MPSKPDNAGIAFGADAASAASADTDATTPNTGTAPADTSATTPTTGTASTDTGAAPTHPDADAPRRTDAGRTYSARHARHGRRATAPTTPANASPDAPNHFAHAALAYPTRAMSWLCTLAVALFGALLRFIRLGEPRAVVFDETYYVKDAWTMLNTGEPRNWPDEVQYLDQSMNPNIPFASGETDLWLGSAEYVVHPPMGKWFIAWGLKLFGGAANPFAWRAATAIAGTIAIIVLIRVLLRLFHNLPIALFGGVLMAIDGVGITMSRTGLLDIFIMALALGAFSLLLMHRDWARARLTRAHAVDPQTRPPQIVFSWYRVGAAVLLGLATGVKWSGTYFMAVFCVISVLWDAWLRHQAGYDHWFLKGALRDGALTACYMLPIYALTYLATWISWFIHPDAYMHDWARLHPGEGVTWLPESLRSFVAYHAQMWQFHTTLDAPHDYKANPLTWPLQIRPTSFYWEKLPDHPGLCSLSPDSQCVAAVTSLGNPIIWWLGSLCAIGAIAIAIARRGDWRIWAVLAGFLGGWLPWAQYLNRTTFTFYSIVLLPWMIIAICYVFDWMRTTIDRAAWQAALGSTLGICLLVSAYFYPIWTAMPVPYDFWLSHMWLESWI